MRRASWKRFMVLASAKSTTLRGAYGTKKVCSTLRSIFPRPHQIVLKSSKVFRPDEKYPEISVARAIRIRWVVGCIETPEVFNLKLKIE
jgi:hypothetical protein